MPKKSDDAVVGCVAKFAEKHNLKRSQSLVWREVASGGIRSLFLQRSSWKKEAYYYPTIAFYPKELLILEELPNEKPLITNFPIQIRLKNIIGDTDWKVSYEVFFDCQMKMAERERFAGIENVLTKFAGPIFYRFSNISSIIKLSESGVLGPGTIRMPALALIKNEHKHLLENYSFQEGELKIIQ